jgi:short subunit fatty acids transporter
MACQLGKGMVTFWSEGAWSVNRYALQVTAPFVIGSTGESADELASALDIIATIHGGAVAESFGTST